MSKTAGKKSAQKFLICQLTLSCARSLFLLFLMVLFCGCSREKTPTEIQGVAMTIPYRVLIGHECQKMLPEIENTILAAFSEINEIYNNWNPDSEISGFNQAPAFENFPLSPKLYAFLKRVETLVFFTEGKFDPTVQKEGPRNAVGWNHIHLENDSIWKDHEKTQIDLGGIAKGYAVDLIVENLQKMGLENIYVEWGGEIKAVGHHPSKRKWRVAIFGLSERIDLDSEAIATSGNYLQNWQDEDKIYTHIINPQTNEPLLVTGASVNSASVIADTCFEADGLATALMVFQSKAAATEWAKEARIKFWIY